MRFKGKFYIPNQTKKFSLFYKLDRVIVQLQNGIHALFIRTNMHGNGIILVNGETVFNGQFL